MTNRLAKGTAVVLVLLACATAAQASYYVPRAHQACKASYRREVVRVRERRHGKLVRRHGRVVRVRQVRCVYVPPKAAAPVQPVPSPPKVTYRAKVDPTFVQSATDPLAVTYSYSADATQVSGAQTVDLASTGQLPAGVLNFYSAQTPGGPEALYCSMNVGDATDGGSCPITYSQTGTYSVTTEYIPTAASAVTETDQETISPYGTTTTLSVTPISCLPLPPPPTSGGADQSCYQLATGVIDQNGEVVAGQELLGFTPTGGDADPLGEGTQMAAGASCEIEVSGGNAGEKGWVVSPDCNFSVGALPGATGENVTGWSVGLAFDGLSGWSPSTAPSASVTP